MRCDCGSDYVEASVLVSENTSSSVEKRWPHTPSQAASMFFTILGCVIAGCAKRRVEAIAKAGKHSAFLIFSQCFCLARETCTVARGISLEEKRCPSQVYKIHIQGRLQALVPRLLACIGSWSAELSRRHRCSCDIKNINSAIKKRKKCREESLPRPSGTRGKSK